MAFNLGAILSLLAAFQLSFMAGYLFTHQKGNRRNNRILACLFLMFAINLFDFTARISGVFLPIPLLHLLDDSFFLLYGPVLYVYTLAVVYHDFSFHQRHLLHAIPAFLVFGYGLSIAFLIDVDIQWEFMTNLGEANVPVWVSMTGLVLYLHMVVYLWMSWRTIKAYRAVLKEQFSTLEGINLDWLRFIIRIFFAITLVALVNGLLPIFGQTLLLYASMIILLVLSVYFINRVLVKALNQPVLFSGITQQETVKYAGSKLNKEDLETYKSRLVELMHTKRLFLDPDLKIGNLASQLEISPKDLSQVINQGFGQNFFDFINSYRCEEVKRLFQGPDKKLTILEAMYQSGFNSKSSFNKEFKKLMGQTPGAFKRQLS